MLGLNLDIIIVDGDWVFVVCVSEYKFEVVKLLVEVKEQVIVLVKYNKVE